MTKNNQTLVFVVIAALLLWQTGSLDGLLGQQVGGDVTPVSDIAIEVCDSTTTPAVTFNGHNKFTGASLSGSIHYRIAPCTGKDSSGKCVSWGDYDGISSTTLGTAIGASPKDKILYIAEVGSYHNVSSEFEVDCKEIIPRSVEFVAFDTSLNYTYLKNEDDTANTGAAEQSIAAGQKKKFEAKIESGADVGGDYYMVIQYNSSEYQKIEIPALGSSISTPEHVDIDDVEYKTVTFNLGELEDNGGKEFSINVEALSNKNPSTDLTVNLYSRAWYIDEAGNRAFVYGMEDEDDTRIGDQTDLEFKVFLS